MRVIVYSTPNKRARHIAESMLHGLKKHGVDARLSRQPRGVEGDIAIAYGWTNESLFRAYRAAGGHYVFWDLGYWNRRPKDRPQDGHHRVAVDSWDTATHMLRGCPADRFRALGIRPIDHAELGVRVLVAGMSDKAAGTHGYAPGQWENAAVKQLREMGADVIHRPKPNKRLAALVPIEIELKQVRLLVTHHSNAAVDALIAGVPVFAVKGVGALMSPEQITLQPEIPSFEARLAFFADVAYAQWTPEEMRNGEAWDYIARILCV